MINILSDRESPVHTLMAEMGYRRNEYRVVTRLEQVRGERNDIGYLFPPPFSGSAVNEDAWKRFTEAAYYSFAEFKNFEDLEDRT